MGSNAKLEQSNRSMNPFRSPRMAFALLLALGGSLIASQMDGAVERTLIVVVTVMIALFIGTEHDLDDKYVIPEREEELIVFDGPITSHHQFQPFLDASTDPTLVIDAARVTAANNAARQLLGPNIVGQNVRLAFRHAGAIERLSDPQAQHSGQPIRLTGIGRKDQLWDMRIQSIEEGQKLVHLADRSAAQAAEKMRVDFVANASHELLTPLAAIKGFIETLGNADAGGNKKTRERFLGIMASETNRMQALIRDLMSLSRIEAEKFEPPKEPVDFGAIVTELVGQLKQSDSERGADLLLDISSSTRPVVGDTGQLRQLASNLVANAMKYGRTGTPVHISVGASPSEAMLSFTVADTGDGIGPEHLPRLTERFYRVDSGRSRSIGGTGLGLSLVKHIVDRHRGHLEIRSTVGEGTTIVILLPVAQDTGGAVT